MRRALLTHPGAWLSLAISFAALALVLVHVVRFGVTREADEGTAARIFQLLMIGQLPIVAFYAVKWLPRNRRQALEVLALQAVTAFAAFATLFVLERGV